MIDLNINDRMLTTGNAINILSNSAEKLNITNT